MKKVSISAYAIVVILVLILIGIYYSINQGDLGRRTDLVGDGVCGNFADEEDQDACCAEGHKDDITIQCVGKWNYVSGLKKCQYVCDGGLVGCPEDAKVCEDGSVVVRNSSLDCEFDECHGE